MDINKSSRIYSIIAAVCYLIFVILEVFQIVKDAEPLLLSRIIFLITMVLFAIFLFIGKRNIGLVIVSGMDVVHSLFFMFLNFHLYDFSDFLYISSEAMLFLIILFSCITALQANAKIIKAIWFLPGVLYLVSSLILYSKIEIFDNLDLVNWQFILSGNLIAIAMLFVGLWLKTEVTSLFSSTSEMIDNNYGTLNPKSFGNYNRSSTIGSADKLKTLKELLDEQIITQEEFDEKKKQILGL